MNKFDSIIIGFGKGGKTLAGELAGRGERVALIEKSAKMYGGTCINVGCIPSKSLISSAHDAGIAEDKKAFYRRSVEKKNKLTSMLRAKNYDKLVTAGVEIIDGTASFAGVNEVKAITSEGEKLLTADKIFINTGAEAVVPAIKGIDGPRVYFSEGLMDLSDLPEKLAIIGAGYIGLEFASMYADFGSQVTVFSDLADFLPREDEDIAASIKEALESRGIAFKFGTKVEEFIDKNKEVIIRYRNSSGTEEMFSADAVLVATGRKPNVADLALDKAGVELTERGAIKVNEKMQTTNPQVWAMGDVTGGLQFTYVSLDDYRIVKSQLFGDGGYDSSKRKNVPYSVFINPPYSRVGLSEKEARDKGLNIRVSKLPVPAIPRAHIVENPKGLLKAVIDADNGQILGAMLFGAESYEVINLIKLAMDAGIPAQVLAQQIYTHPTMSEALNDLFA